jgi:hypothetical protein
MASNRIESLDCEKARGLVGKYGLYGAGPSVNHPDDMICRIAYENIVFFICGLGT